MTEVFVDQEIQLIPYYPNPEVALAWYQDKEVCKQVDDTEELYSIEKLTGMYDYLNRHGDLYYIQYNGVLVGDVVLKDDGEICIVICKEYQNRQIGRRCIRHMLELADRKGFPTVKARIYRFNEQSRHMFQAVGFREESDEWFVYRFGEEHDEN